MTAARRTPRAAGWIVGRFVGSGHFNISPEPALEVAAGTARGPERAVGRAGRGRPGRYRRFRTTPIGTPAGAIRRTERERRTDGDRCNLAAAWIAKRRVCTHRTRDARPTPDARTRHDAPRHAGACRMPAPCAQRVAARPRCGRARWRAAALTRRARRPPGRPLRSTDAAPHTRATAASLRCGASGW